MVTRMSRRQTDNPFVVPAFAPLGMVGRLPFAACLGSSRKERLSCIASLFPWQSPCCCYCRQESWRASESAQPRRAALLPRETLCITRSGGPPPLCRSKIFIPQVQPRAPSRKGNAHAPRLVQADEFFNCDSHGFNNRSSVKHHAERDLRNFLRNATVKV